MLTSDVLHKKASKEFLNTFGFGSWFAPLVGLWEASVAALLWYDGGAYRSGAGIRRAPWALTRRASRKRRGISIDARRGNALDPPGTRPSGFRWPLWY